MEERRHRRRQRKRAVSPQSSAAPRSRAARLHLYFQPIVSLSDRSATMLEALPRWPHPEHGILAPADFIDGRRVEDDLLAPAGALGDRRPPSDQLSRWSSGVASELTISLNLSEEHLFESDLAERGRAAAPRSGGSTPSRLGFEITESALVEADGRSLDKLREPGRARGLADRSTTTAGRDSAELLREPCPLTALKISRRLVAGIPDDDHRIEAVPRRDRARPRAQVWRRSPAESRARRSWPASATSAAATRRASCSRCRCRPRCSRSGCGAARRTPRSSSSEGSMSAGAASVTRVGVAAALDRLPGDHALGHVAARGQLELDVEQRLLEDRAQAAGAGLALQGLVGDRRRASPRRRPARCRRTRRSAGTAGSARCAARSGS